MTLSRKMSCFFFAFFFILAQFLSGCQAGLEYSQPFPGGKLNPSPIISTFRTPSWSVFAVCEPCWLGRGKCRRICTEDEKIVGNCKMNLFCCRWRIR
uniref:Beta-defensin n=1 Tax=Canis lupus dingo TaxID=286419 RepID=A0A8C0KID8_CANLU